MEVKQSLMDNMKTFRRQETLHLDPNVSFSMVLIKQKREHKETTDMCVIQFNHNTMTMFFRNVPEEEFKVHTVSRWTTLSDEAIWEEFYRSLINSSKTEDVA